MFNRNDICPVCETERLTLECEVDAGCCVDCSADIAGFHQSQDELKTTIQEAL